jgi:hypothetical protein
VAVWPWDLLQYAKERGWLFQCINIILVSRWFNQDDKFGSSCSEPCHFWDAAIDALVGVVVKIVWSKGFLIDGRKSVLASVGMPFQTHHFHQCRMQHLVLSVIYLFLQSIHLCQQHLVHESVEHLFHPLMQYCVAYWSFSFGCCHKASDDWDVLWNFDEIKVWVKDLVLKQTYQIFK